MSRMSFLTSTRPPTSSHPTLGILGAPILSLKLPLTSDNAWSKSAILIPTPASSKSDMEIFVVEENVWYRSCAAESARIHKSMRWTGTNAAVRIARAGIETSCMSGSGAVNVLRISRRSNSEGALN